ncbi:MAG: hypothetical protein J7L61_02080, partial [Thermoplasmata archaeon]|nr:hypothetical protein [Thermoplasmata archaeon]
GGGLFDIFFGPGAGGMGSGRRHPPGDMRHDLNLTLEDVYRGGEKEVIYYREEPCGECGGTGAAPGTKPVKCPACGGTGQIKEVTRRGYSQFIRVGPCGRCRGRGEIIESPCGACRGRGVVRQKRRLMLTIEPGMDEGQVLRLKGEGNISKDGRRGDLYVVVHVAPHPVFKRDGQDLWEEVKIPYTRAILGGEVEIPLLEGTHLLKIPPGTQPDTVIRVRGKGLPNPKSGGMRVGKGGGRGMGDLYVRVKVAIPKRLSRRERELLEELDRLGGSGGAGGGGRRGTRGWSRKSGRSGGKPGSESEKEESDGATEDTMGGGPGWVS